MKRKVLLLVPALCLLLSGAKTYAYWTDELNIKLKVPMVYDVNIQITDETELFEDGTSNEGVVADVVKNLEIVSKESVPSQEVKEDTVTEESPKVETGAESVSSEQEIKDDIVESPGL